MNLPTLPKASQDAPDPGSVATRPINGCAVGVSLREQHAALCPEHGALAVRECLGLITEPERIRLDAIRAELDVIEMAMADRVTQDVWLWENAP